MEQSALDVVEAVITILEDDASFNAGKGSVLNQAGKAELDASIMNGANLACGAVAGVTVVKNPIQVARSVMEETPHVLLVSQGAEEFAKKSGAVQVDLAIFLVLSCAPEIILSMEIGRLPEKISIMAP